MIPALATITLAAFVARLVIREHQRELRVAQALLVADMRADDRAAEVAGDVLARARREALLREATARVDQAFHNAIDTLAATEAARADWTELEKWSEQ